MMRGHNDSGGRVPDDGKEKGRDNKGFGPLLTYSQVSLRWYSIIAENDKGDKSLSPAMSACNQEDRKKRDFQI